MYKYLGDKRNSLNVIHDYLIIKKAFLCYNTCLQSSAAIERLFSFVPIISNLGHHALHDYNFEKLVILEANEINRQRRCLLFLNSKCLLQKLGWSISFRKKLFCAFLID